MAHVINSSCNACGACTTGQICPVYAIIEGEDQFSINPDLCLDCGTCEDACPLGAITQE